jgi:hypothetical protein
MREVDDNLQHLERVRSSSTQYSDGGIANRRIEVVIPHVNQVLQREVTNGTPIRTFGLYRIARRGCV